MSDYTGFMIAKAIKFLGLCLFYGLVMGLGRVASNPQTAMNTIESEYNK